MASRFSAAVVAVCCRKAVMSVALRGSYTIGCGELALIHSVLVAGT